MKAHIESVHEGKKKFKCQICDYSCHTKCNMNRHISIVHEENKPFDCNICEKAFSSRHSIKHHIVSVHEEKNIKMNLREKRLRLR